MNSLRGDNKCLREEVTGLRAKLTELEAENLDWKRQILERDTTVRNLRAQLEEQQQEQHDLAEEHDEWLGKLKDNCVIAGNINYFIGGLSTLIEGFRQQILESCEDMKKINRETPASPARSKEQINRDIIRARNSRLPYTTLT